MAKRTLYDADGNPIEVDDPDFEETPEQPKTNAAWAKLRKDASERDTFARENAILRAGIPADNPLTEYFVAGYKGEMTKAAIVAAATAAGLLAAAKAEEPPSAGPVDPTNPVSQERLDAANLSEGDRIAAAANGGGNIAQDPNQVLEAAYAKGGNDAVLQIMREAGFPVRDTAD